MTPRAGRTVASGGTGASGNGSRAGLLAGYRTGAASYFDRAGLPEYELKPLDDQAAAQLVTARFPDLDPW